jgi:effector-binding domain-containing protein
LSRRTRHRTVGGAPFVHDRLPNGPAVQIVHLGSIDSLLFTYDRLGEWLAVHHVQPTTLMWEEYLIGSDDTDQCAAWRTRVVCPLPAEPARSSPTPVPD